MSASAINYSGGFSPLCSSTPVAVAEFNSHTLGDWLGKTKSFNGEQIN